MKKSKTPPLALVLGCVALAVVLIVAGVSVVKGYRSHSSPSDDAAERPLILQYDSPADNTHEGWENWALPLGNGRQGAMVFGRTDTERLQLNEDTFWNGGIGGTDSEPGGVYDQKDSGADHFGNVDAYGSGAMQRFVDRLFDGYYSNKTDTNYPDIEGPEKILQNHNSALGDYQNFAELYLDLDHQNTQNYRRELDIRKALSTVSYDHDGATITRQMFANHPSNVMVYTISSTKPEGVTFTLRPEIPDLGTTEGGRGNKSVTKEGTVKADQDNQTITMQGKIVNNGMKFAGQFKVATDGGNVTADNPKVADYPDSEGKLTVKNANSATIYIALGTNYENTYPNYRQQDPDFAINDVQGRISNALNKGRDELLSEHLKDYQELFSRVNVNLGGTYDPNLATDKLLYQWKIDSAENKQNHYLEELYYQYGRYLLISSSRDSLPANLQGLWNDKAFPIWQSDYHNNINTEMNYWPAFSTNLAETAAPLVNYVSSLKEPGSVTAKKLYGVSDTWTVNGATNALGHTAPTDWRPTALIPTTSAFLLENVYENYRFTQDKELLRTTIYPMMKSACKLFLDGLLHHGRKDSDKSRLFVAPSFSSEHGIWTIGSAFDQQLVYILFTDTLDAIEQLGLTGEAHDFVRQLTDSKNALYPVLIGEDGQIKEWQQEGKYNRYKFDPSKKIGEDNHRHNGQLMMLHPGSFITTEKQQWMDAARVSLNLRGDGASGWSMGQKLNMWARLQDGNHAYDKLFINLMKNGTATNLFDLHPPFQIDGNFGGTAGMTEMLLQSHAGYLSILPALPDAWASGSVKGIVARGNFVVDMAWKDKKATQIDVLSRSGGRLALKAEGIKKIIDKTTGQEVKETSRDRNDSLFFNTEAGHTYEIVV